MPSKVQNITFMAPQDIPTISLTPGNLLSNYDRSWFIWHWMIWEVLLTGN